MTALLVEGSGTGPLIVLTEPVSFWGGVNPLTGEIIDSSHPELGVGITGSILALPHGRGSSSSATVLAEMVRTGTAPAGILLDEADLILVTGGYVANSLYGTNFVMAVGPIPDRRKVIYRLDKAGLFEIPPEND